MVKVAHVARARGSPWTALVLLIGLAPACGRRNAAADLEDGELEVAGDRLPYALFVPPRVAHPAPLVVMLHGCKTEIEQVIDTTRWNRIAEANGAMVVYPAQIETRNGWRCWNWFDAAHQRRGRGEPALLVALVRRLIRDRKVDPRRVYAVGFSAGAGMAAVLGACYPDVFAAIGVHSGAEYLGGNPRARAVESIEKGGPDPDEQGRRAHACAGTAARVLPAIVIQGSTDAEVVPVNGAQVFAQIAESNDLADDGRDNDSISVGSATRTESSAGGRAFTAWQIERQGRPLLLRYEVDGLAHRWSGSSGNGGPSATRLFWDFFAAHPR